MSNVDYIKLLASQTAADISGWDLRMFNRLEDKNQINKAFFDRKNAQTTEVKVVPKRMVKKLNIAKFDTSRFIKKLESSQDRLHEKILALYGRIEEVNKLIVDQSNKINKLNSFSGYVLEDEINKVLEQGHWENPIVDKGWLYFNTKNEVICSVSNANAGVELKINLGKYAVAINLKTLELRGLPFENNLIYKYNCTIHPFIAANDGYICWGNGIPMLAKFKRELSLPKMLNFFYVLLSVYDDTAHPFTPLTSFNKASKIDFKLFLKGKYDCDGLKPKIVHPDVRKKFVDTKTKKV